MRWRERAIVAFDTETTGLLPFGGDRIIEFAAVRMWLAPDGSVARTEPFTRLVNPGIPIPRKVTELTGISDATVAGAPPFSTIASEVHTLLSDAVTVAHNYPFDLAFLTGELRAAGLGWPAPLAEIDTVDLSIAKFPEERTHKLGDLCARLGIPLVGAHRAEADAAATGACFAALARRHEVDDELQTLLDWARAIGRPPDDGALAVDTRCRVVFAAGRHHGAPVADHPVELAWMATAKVLGPQGWGWRFSDATRRWARRWLDVRGAGRSPTSPKVPHATDWVLDSCALPDRAPERAPSRGRDDLHLRTVN